jgi:hypothetical protein
VNVGRYATNHGCDHVRRSRSVKNVGRKVRKLSSKGLNPRQLHAEDRAHGFLDLRGDEESAMVQISSRTKLQVLDQRSEQDAARHAAPCLISIGRTKLSKVLQMIAQTRKPLPHTAPRVE